MSKTRKKPKHRIKGRQPPKKKSKSSSSLVKWIIIFSAIAVVGSAAIWGGKKLFHSSPNTPDEIPSVTPTKPVEDSTVPSKLTAELDSAALKKTELALIETVLRDFPDNEDALKLVGDFYSRHGKRTEALKFWQKCLEINPMRLDIYRNIGEVAIEHAEFEEAVTQVTKAVEIDPKVRGIREKIGHALVELGRYDEAVKQLEQELLVSPPSVKINFLLGQAYLKLKEYEKAQVYYHKALEITPDLENAYYGLARVYAALKQKEKAKEYQNKFRKFQGLRAKDSRALSSGASLYTRDLSKLRRAVVQTHLDAHKLYLARADVGKTEELLKKAIEIDPDNISSYERLGALYHKTNRLTEAVSQFQIISQIEPSNIYSYLNIGMLSTKLMKYNDAEAAYARVITIAPQQAVGYRELARLYLMNNINIIEAGKLAQKAVELEPSAENFFVLGWAFHLNGDLNRALKAIQEAIKLEPNNPKYRRIYESIKATS